MDILISNTRKQASVQEKQQATISKKNLNRRIEKLQPVSLAAWAGLVPALLGSNGKSFPNAQFSCNFGEMLTCILTNKFYYNDQKEKPECQSER